MFPAGKMPKVGRLLVLQFQIRSLITEIGVESGPNRSLYLAATAGCPQTRKAVGFATIHFLHSILVGIDVPNSMLVSKLL